MRRIKSALVIFIGLIVLIGIYGTMIHLTCKMTGERSIVVGGNTVACPR